MKILFFGVSFLFFSISIASPLRCRDLFLRPENRPLRAAIRLGVEVFNRRQDTSRFKNVYLHATSIESIERSRDSVLIANSMQDYGFLAPLFYIYDDQAATYAFFQEDALSLSDSGYLYDFAELAAKKRYILRALSSPEITAQWFIDELVDLLIVQSDVELKEFLVSLLSAGDPTDPRMTLLAAQLASVDFRFLYSQMDRRHGAVVVIDEKIRFTYPVEHDPEFLNSFAIFTPEGIPWEFVRAIIPQSGTERDQLLRFSDSLP